MSTFEEKNMLDLLKILLVTPFLLYSCYSDLKTRRVPNKLWILMLLTGSPFMTYDILMGGWYYLFRIFISVVSMFIFVYLLFRLGVFGGADAKSLILLSLIFPLYPAFTLFGHSFPINEPLSIFKDFFSFGIFENAVLLTVVVPLCLLIYNISKMGFHIDKPLYALVGYKVRISEISSKQHIRMIEDFEIEGDRIKVFFKRGGVDITNETIDELKRLSEKGLMKEVWVTPGLPFMIPITLGFFASAFYGNLLLEIMKLSLT